MTLNEWLALRGPSLPATWRQELEAIAAGSVTAPADIIRHARWVHARARTWELRARKKDGGAVLATIEGVPGGYQWTAGADSGAAARRNQAELAARKALREGVGDGH